jgi:preprotein translocase subunit SecB
MSNQEENKPQISVHTQYTKDLSFENPGAPMSLTKLNTAPKIDLSIDIEVHPMLNEEKNTQELFEVVLAVKCKAILDNKTLFILELKYGGVVSVQNFNEADKNIMLAVYTPSILFPFARAIVAKTTQEGGFQPLMIDPIDFGALYQKQQEQQAQSN